MELEITLPHEIAVMTLPGAVLFPQAVMPLHIFEPRYRAMLRDVLASHRLFAIAGLDEQAAAGRFEPPHRIATVGIVRACQKSDDGTSHLLLQGLTRVEINGIRREEPYRRISVRPLASSPGADAGENLRLRVGLTRLITQHQRLAGGAAGDITPLLKAVDDPEACVDIAAFSLCADPRLRQSLLETLEVTARLRLFGQYLQRQIDAISLSQRLQGSLADDDIASN